MAIVKKDQENFLFKIRAKYNLSQIEMSAELNCSQGYLSRVENNQITPDVNLLVNLREKYNTNINKLIDSGVFDV